MAKRERGVSIVQVKTLVELTVCPYYIEGEEDCGLCVNKCSYLGNNESCIIYNSMINKGKER